MRDHWPRARPALELDAPTVEGLIQELFPGCRVVAIETVTGGLTNTNLRLRLADRKGAILLRFYQRGGDLAQKEMALCHMLGKQVRVPSYLHFAPENPVTGHAFAVLEWIDAVPLQSILAELDRAALAVVGAAIGAALAAIHSFSYEHFGFFDGELTLGAPIDLGRDGLVEYLRQTLVDGLGGPRLGRDFTADVLAFAAREGRIIESWQHKPCLAHGDFNLSNILVQPKGSGWDLAAIIDWEFAFAGGAGFDFGNLLRPPLGQAVEFTRAVATSYRAAGAEMPEDWQRIAQITDLFSIADTLHHPETEGAVIDDMKDLIRKLMAGSRP